MKPDIRCNPSSALDTVPLPSEEESDTEPESTTGMPNVFFSEYDEGVLWEKIKTRKGKMGTLYYNAFIFLCYNLKLNEIHKILPLK